MRKFKEFFWYFAPEGCFTLVMIAIIIAIFCLLGCSCKAQREVQIERVEVPVVVTQEHTIESVKIDHIRDTLIQRDSVYYYVKGDTTIIERWHHTQGNTIITKVDTLHIFDSVPYPVEVTTEKVVTKIEKVDKPLKWWQKWLMLVGGITMLGGGAWLILRTRKMI